jgi:hypothetical protein
MPALYPVWMDHAVRAVLVCAGTSLLALPTLLVLSVRTPYGTGQFRAVDQPVQFDHRHHVNDDGIGCAYCHEGALRGPYAGIPPTERCMGCHAQIWPDSPLLRPVRESAFTGRPIAWNRVHRLPDFVFFNHAAHVNRGVGCVTCHGRVDLMPQVYPVAPLTMGWCLDCHRDPAPHLRPLERVMDASWEPPGSARAAGEQVRRALDVAPPATCTGCHR